MAAPWAWSLGTLKPTADKEMAEGINRFVIHCSVHQPLVGKAPGLGLGRSGSGLPAMRPGQRTPRPG